MRQIVDPRTGEYLWSCPECGKTIRLSSRAAVFLAEQAGRCQGCRARATFERKPGLVGFYLDFWVRADAWPQSDSWMQALSMSGVSIVGNGSSEPHMADPQPEALPTPSP